jgi:hypothetical protein
VLQYQANLREGYQAVKYKKSKQKQETQALDRILAMVSNSKGRVQSARMACFTHITHMLLSAVQQTQRLQLQFRVHAMMHPSFSKQTNSNPCFLQAGTVAPGHHVLCLFLLSFEIPTTKGWLVLLTMM